MLTVLAINLPGCLQPTPVIYLAPDSQSRQIHASGDYQISSFHVKSQSLALLADDIKALLEAQCSSLYQNTATATPAPLKTIDLLCIVEADQVLTLDEPIFEDVRLTARFDIRDTATLELTRSFHFQYLEKIGKRNSLRSCLHDWTGRVLSLLQPVKKNQSYNLARGLSEHDRRGRTYVKQGHYELALGEFQKAIDANPGDHAALYNAGLICEWLGEHERALQFYQRANRISRQEIYQLATARLEKFQ